MWDSLLQFSTDAKNKTFYSGVSMDGFIEGT